MVQITGGTRPGNGTNLFHSFDQLSVGRGDTAQFLNITPSLHTSNILSRVTGGNPTSIFGTIDTLSYPGANLFLMNPAGLVFGPNASLNVGGSVTFTTADYLRLGDSGRFNSVPNATADGLLSTAPVVAYGFLGSNPGGITIQGSRLTVPERQGISIIGGNITIQKGVSEKNESAQSARLSAPNGQVNLATTKSPGEFLKDLSIAANINGESFMSFGSAHFASGSIVDVSQTENGNVSIRGGQLILEIHNASLDTTNGTGHTIMAQGQDTIILAPGSLITSQTFSSNEGADVQLGADQITILGIPDSKANAAELPFTGVRTNSQGGGKAGNIIVKTVGDIQITNKATLEALSGFSSDGKAASPIRGIGEAGNVELTSIHGNIRMTGSDHARVQVTSQTLNTTGNTGNIKIDAPYGDIILDNSDLFNSANDTGTLGNIQINAHDLHLRNASRLGGDNNTSPQVPGNITIILDGQLELADGSFINTEAFGSANSADLIIKSPTVLIIGKDSSGKQHSGLFTDTIGSGNGGRLRLFTDNLHLADGGILSSKSFIGFENKIPSGHGGVISVEGYRNPGTSMTIDGSGSGIFANAQGTGVGGDIFVTANSVMMTNGASITASSTVKPDIPNSGFANAGNISINAGQQLDLAGKSSITTEAKQASGGNIDIKAVDSVRLVDSTISTSVKGAKGSGGNIFIDPKVVILEGSNVTAQAVGGTGGNITFVTPLFLADSASLVSASSERGVNGTVTIQSPTANLSGTVGQLVSKTSPPQVLLQNRCVALAGGEQSTFILAGRDTVPAEPGGWLSSPVSMEHWTGEETEEHASGLMVRSRGSNISPSVTAQKDETTVLSLRRLTPPGFLVRTFAIESTGCPS